MQLSSAFPVLLIAVLLALTSAVLKPVPATRTKISKKSSWRCYTETTETNLFEVGVTNSVLGMLTVVIFCVEHVGLCISMITSMILNERKKIKVKKPRAKLSALERRKFVRHANARRQRLEEHAYSSPDIWGKFKLSIFWFLLMFNPHFCEALLLTPGSSGDGEQSVTESFTSSTDTGTNGLESDEQQALKLKTSKSSDGSLAKTTDKIQGLAHIKSETNQNGHEVRRRLVDKFAVTSGSGCTTSGNCFESLNFPNDYGKSESCSVTVQSVLAGESLYSAAFNTESGDDKLIVGSTTYSGTSGPSNVAVSVNDVITWSSDGGTQKSGFQVCLVAACLQTDGSQANSDACRCGTAACTAAVGLFCTSSTNTCSPYVSCSVVDGSSVNSESCACGTTDCTAASNGLFCRSSTNTCSSFPVVDCDFKLSDDPSLASTDGWNMLLASCVMGSTISVGSGKTMKVKRDHAGFLALVNVAKKTGNDLTRWLSTPTVIDRQATSSNRGMHFQVSGGWSLGNGQYHSGGSLELEGVTLKGGYSVSFFEILHREDGVVFV